MKTPDFRYLINILLKWFEQAGFLIIKLLIILLLSLSVVKSSRFSVTLVGLHLEHFRISCSNFLSLCLILHVKTDFNYSVHCFSLKSSFFAVTLLHFKFRMRSIYLSIHFHLQRFPVFQVAWIMRIINLFNPESAALGWLDRSWFRFTMWKMSIFEVFLVRIFRHFDWIRRFTSKNTEQKKTPNGNTFYAVFLIEYLARIYQIGFSFCWIFSIFVSVIWDVACFMVCLSSI